jgi:cell wall-associated NlpC family hydrolase
MEQVPGKKYLASFLFCIVLLLNPIAWASPIRYSLGDSGLAVAQIQAGLKDAGYFGGQVDGKFSNLTRQAVVNFQKAAGLKADGVVEAKTFKALTGKDIPRSATKSPGQTLTEPDRKASAILATALSYHGVKYRFGGSSPVGFDCSGYVMHVFNRHGIQLPRTADKQFSVGKPVKWKAELKPGDLVFFETYEKGPSHVGIYQGKGKFIHASSNRGVMVSGLSEVYYAKRYLGARRIL